MQKLKMRKKLMAMLTAAAMAFGLFAEGDQLNELIGGTTFNGWTSTTPPVGEELALLGGELGESSIIPADWNKEVWSASGCGVPDRWKGISPNEALGIKNALGTEFGTCTPNLNPLPQDSKFYFDSLVKFTVCDEDVQISDADAKIAVWIRELYADDGVTVAGTNLFVMAGKVSGTAATGERVVYDCGPYTALDGDWSRLTIRSMGEVSANSGVYGFVVYVNGKLVKAVTSVDFGDLTLEKLPQHYAYNNSLFPCIAQQPAIQGVLAFSGKGALDDIAFTTAQPSFERSVQYYAVLWDPDKVEAIAIHDPITGDKTATAAELAAGRMIINYGDYRVDAVQVTWTAKPGYISGSKAFANTDDVVDLTDTLRPANVYNGSKAYETIAEAMAEAADGDVLTLSNNVADVTATVDKAVTLDLNGKMISLSSSAEVGLDVKAAATIQNGSIVSTRETYGTAYAILNEAVDATYKDLTIDATNCKFGLACDSPAVTDDDIKGECETDPTVTVNCENVDIVGNGGLFYAQHTILNLDADCSAVKTGASAGYAAAVYSALNATVNIAGGTYGHDYALISGNLGGKIVVSGGAFTGDIKSYMAVGAHEELEEIPGYKATFAFNGGTYAGGIVFEDADARALDSFTKGAEVEIAAPEGYIWFNDTKLCKPIIATFKVGNAVVSAQTNDVPFTPEVPVDPTVSPGYTFEGWQPEVGQIDTSTEFSAVIKEILVSSITLDKDVVVLNPGDVSNLVATINPPEAWVALHDDVQWRWVDKEAVDYYARIVVHQNQNEISIIAEKAQPAGSAPLAIEAYVTDKDIDDYYVAATCLVTVVERAGGWPTGWPEADDEVKAKFTAWRTGVGAGADLTTEDAQKAFLLNVAVENIKELKIESLDVDSEGYSTIVVSAPGAFFFDRIDTKNINGILYIEAGKSLKDMVPKAITYWTTTTGKAMIKVKENFIRAVIGFKAPDVPADTQLPPEQE